MNRRAFYREDGGKFLLEVRRDEIRAASDGRPFRFVEATCLETVRPSPLHGSVPVGAEVNVDCAVGSETAVGWTLEYLS